MATGSTLHSVDASAANVKQPTATAAAREERACCRLEAPSTRRAASAAPHMAAAASAGQTAWSSHRPVRSSTLLENSRSGPLVNTSRAPAATAAAPQ